MKLNLSEKKVLSILEIDCRMPANQIAKKLKLSTEGVIKIINRLKDKNVIKKFNTKVNYSKMGYRLYPVHIKLTKRDNTVVKKIIAIVKKYKTCVWHMFCEGEYDLLLSFSIKAEKDKEDMTELLNEISTFTSEKEISVVLNAFEINKSFAETKQPKVFPIFDYKVECETLKEKELDLIKLLRQNSRDTILNIAKKLSINPRAAIVSMKKLQKNNVISGYKTKVNMATLNYHPCMALISINKIEGGQYDSFVSYCKRTKGIHYFVRQLGNYDIELTFDVLDIHSFYGIIDEIRNKFSFVKKITTLVVKK